MSKRILVIDDDENFISNLLTEFGEDEQVIVAKDGEQGLEMARNESPEVILLDIVLPKVFGLRVLESLKSEEETKFIPVVANSNFGGEENERRAIEMGASEFIAKNDVTPQQIAGILRKYLQE